MNIINDKKQTTKFIDMRASRLEPIHRGSVLLSKQEDLCSTSYYSSRRKNTSTLRVITLREGRILPLYESLFEKEEHFHSTSHSILFRFYSSREELYESLLFEGRTSCSTSYYSSRKEFPALRVITLREERVSLHE